MSKELYNHCNFHMRQAFFANQRVPDINLLRNKVKDLDTFGQFGNTKTAMQTIRLVLSNWSNFLKSLKVYKKDKSKFISCPKPPNYKNKFAQVIFFNETIKDGQSKKKILTELTANNNCFSVPFKEDYKQVVITPKTFGFMIEVRYEQKATNIDNKLKLNKDKHMNIDMGVNNLAAITLDQHCPILVNGRILKSINQWYNKLPSKNRLRKRYFRIENYFHHTSKLIIDLCVKNNIGTIIIGKNDGWKTHIKMRKKKDNQNFQGIPFTNLFGKIQYKAALIGIQVIYTEEAYTSAASFFNNDLLPRFDEPEPKLSGDRKERGLYVTKDGFAVNADVNGSLNIGRKVIPEFQLNEIGDRSLAARPVVINPLRQHNGEGCVVNLL